ncbi:MAG TPA: hypothetical protein VML00_00345 [Bacteroidota bacterium]|nr:hypothetical protein [Bacteroidota bacterium]
MRTTLAALITCVCIDATGCADIGSPAEIASASIPGIPLWLQSRIALYEISQFGTVPSEVWQYRYGGETVYFIPSPCCDMFNYLFDASGTIMCAPNGGFSGAGDGRCTDFFRTRTNEVLIWRDSRAHLSAQPPR